MQSPCETELCQYHYDALDRLIANVVPCKPQHHRFYCKSRLATEIQGATRYSMFQHGDRLLAQQQNDGGGPDSTLLATDQQRSVLHTLEANHPRRSITYSPYGHRPDASGLLSLLGFNGERPDPVTGHYLLGNGYRAFNPVLMRFNSPDSLSPFGNGGLNSYAYCLADPVNRVDPSGQTSIGEYFAAFRTRRTNIYKHGGQVQIRPDASTREAMRARTELLDIEQELKHYEQLRHNKFISDYENRSPPHQLINHTKSSNDPLTLRKTATNTVLSNGTNFNEVPDTLKTKIQLRIDAYSLMLEEIHSGLDTIPFDARNLSSIARGWNPGPWSKQHHKLAEKFARRYELEMDAIRSPRDAELRTRRGELIRTYFIH